MNLIRKFRSDKKGSAAIEFAMLIGPLALTIFVILEIALLFFVDSALDSALHKTARSVRVGTAQDENWDIDTFKDELCSNMAYYFDCANEVLIISTVVSDISSVSYIAGTKDGELNVTESFDAGDSSDYVLIQAFLPWNPIIPLYSFSSSTLTDGTYILGSAVLQKNEPF